MPPLCECQEGYSCVNVNDSYDICIVSPTAEEFPPLEGELYREIVTDDGGGDPVLVILVAESLYVVTNSTILKFEPLPKLDDNSQDLTRFFNFEANLGAQNTTDGSGAESSEVITYFPLPLGPSRRARRLAAGSCEHLKREEAMCVVQDDGATALGNSCISIAYTCLFSIVVSPLEPLCTIVISHCALTQDLLCSDERRSERQEMFVCCDLSVRTILT